MSVEDRVQDWQSGSLAPAPAAPVPKGTQLAHQWNTNGTSIGAGNLDRGTSQSRASRRRQQALTGPSVNQIVGSGVGWNWARPS